MGRSAQRTLMELKSVLRLSETSLSYVFWVLLWPLNWILKGAVDLLIVFFFISVKIDHLLLYFEILLPCLSRWFNILLSGRFGHLRLSCF